MFYHIQTMYSIKRTSNYRITNMSKLKNTKLEETTRVETYISDTL